MAEIDRQYELNNNADLDNGVYHHEEERDGGACNDDTKQSMKDNGGGIPTSVYNQEQNLVTSFGKHELESQLGELAIESNSSNEDDNFNTSFEDEQN